MARPGRPYNRIQLPPHCTGCNRNADLIRYMKRRDKMVAKTLEAAFEDVIICTLPALLFPPPLRLKLSASNHCLCQPPDNYESYYKPRKWRVIPLVVIGFTV
jgi:hypothetical protein